MNHGSYIREQKTRRDQLYGLLGDLPDRNRPVSAALIIEEECPAYVLEKLMLDLNGIEPVPAYFTRPRASATPMPTILYNHAHGGAYDIGKEDDPTTPVVLAFIARHSRSASAQ